MHLTHLSRNARITALAVMSGLLALAGAATRVNAQCGNPGDVATNCLPQTSPSAIAHEDFSRDVRGEAFIGPETSVRIRQCGTNVRTRTVSNLPIVLNLCQERSCDELTLPPPCFVRHGYILNGLYSSSTRLRDPCANVDSAGLALQNTRIGVFSARGDVLDCNGAKVGAWTLEGTVGTNNTSQVAGASCGECYSCDHHAGLLKIVGLKDSGKFCPPSNIVALMQFDTNKSRCPVPGPTCDDLDPCEVAFIVQGGAVDGVYRRPCCHALDDPTGGGNGHGNPNSIETEALDPGEIEIIELP